MAQVRDHLYSVSAPAPQRGWAAGAFGTILATEDGGNTWNAQTSNTEEHLFGIDFADTQTGWAVGRTGVILHTRDGGTIWQIQASPLEDRHLFDVCAIGPKHAVAIGDWGAVLTTDDAGTTWTDRSFSRDVILNGQHWLDPLRGWIVGEGGIILATVDAGRSWAEQPSGVFKTLFGVSFTNERDGWVSGLDGLILRTRDGGQSWTALRGATDLGSFDDSGFADAFGNPTLFDISVQGTHGVAVGDLGGLFVSRDSGETWTREELAGEAGLQWIRSVDLSAAGNGYLVGAKGMRARVAGDRILLP